LPNTDYENGLQQLRAAIDAADAVVLGAGAGLSTAAGLTYSGERFERLFGDFIAKYGIRDMYSGGFFPFPSLEEQWAWWSRHIWCNRYEPAPKDTYGKLLRLLAGKDFFVITTNVDHQFQLSGFPKERLFYTQGDYGLWQCSEPCHDKTYDNYDTVKRMVEEQRDMRVPSELLPYCPVCGKPMAMNLRADDTFVEDAGWHRASAAYAQFLRRHKDLHTLYLEIGVGSNTPVIIKYPFWAMTAENPRAVYACLNYGEAFCPREIEGQSICVDGDTCEVARLLLRKGE
jgi:NAD-dependent SIR2 family protein deacetylase